jgi:hypothetical protein
MKTKSASRSFFIRKAPAPMVGLRAQLEARIQGARLQHWQLRYTPEISLHGNDVILQIVCRFLAVFVLALPALFIFGGQIFYENVERGIFVSLIYGVFEGVIL